MAFPFPVRTDKEARTFCVRHLYARHEIPEDDHGRMRRDIIPDLFRIVDIKQQVDSFFKPAVDPDKF